jgi:hypothetical protein
MPIPTNKRFIRELAFRLCIQAGDSWVADDGAQDQWQSTALEFAKEANKVERWQRRTKDRKSRTLDTVGHRA